MTGKTHLSTLAPTGRSFSARTRKGRTAVLLDLPTYPKGVMALSLPAVVAALPKDLSVQIIDLNVHDVAALLKMPERSLHFIGMKVSAQNHAIAEELTMQIRAVFTDTPIVWGGEFPTLVPEHALQFADAIIQGAFEGSAAPFIHDLEAGTLHNRYASHGNVPRGQAVSFTHFDLSSYASYMGLPMEISRGCDKKCTFCMVHTMQPSAVQHSLDLLQREMPVYAGHFVNVIDYNIGVDKAHLLEVTRLFAASEIVGWMGEMCLESLDDEEILAALKASRCKMIYCGLESIDELALKSVNKAKTNQLQNYERIIHKAQSYGIQIAAGVILGLEGSSAESMERTLQQFENWGIIYAKLTFLTYNPGTKVKQSMRKKGTFLTEEYRFYDGNHLTFLPHGVDAQEVFAGAYSFIDKFYSRESMERRADKTGLSGNAREEFILFNLAYGSVYQDWKKHRIFEHESAFTTLLTAPYRKSDPVRDLEQRIAELRRAAYLELQA